jgi:electron transport complex protein RnfC
MVPTGIHYHELVEAAGGFVGQPKKLISGGTMMGQSVYNLDIPVTKTSSALLAFINDEIEAMPEGNCIHCGSCVKVCPCRLVPQKMVQCATRGDKEGFVKLHGMECYECGSCTYVCPAGIFLTQSFKQMRRNIIEDRKKAN